MFSFLDWTTVCASRHSLTGSVARSIFLVYRKTKNYFSSSVWQRDCVRRKSFGTTAHAHSLAHACVCARARVCARKCTQACPKACTRESAWLLSAGARLAPCSSTSCVRNCPNKIITRRVTKCCLTTKCNVGLSHGEKRPPPSRMLLALITGV
jgi:hypothetical protein